MQFLIILATISLVWCYEIAPITEDMVEAANKIIANLLPENGGTQLSSVPWQRLAYICDTFGPRFSGSDGLENALSYIRDLATNDGLKVTEQMTMIPKWVRGQEFATMIAPRVKKLHMVGLGMSNSTHGKNITGHVIVVSGYDDMQAKCADVNGKIVLFNTIFTTYGDTVSTRTNAAIWGASCGAIAALIRSIGPFSMQNTHTGASTTGSIPAAAISNEDASQIQRMQDRGQDVVVSLYMENTFYPDVQSRNLLIDLVGSELPDEIVLASGHGDSWDIAEGAMDDGGGFMSAWEAVRVMNQLGLKPKRTIRAVVWTNEENGDRGGQQYRTDGLAANTLIKHSIAIETDGGAFFPLGLGISCSQNTNGGCGMAMAQLKALSPLLEAIGGGQILSGGGGADIEPICETGIVCGGWLVLDPRLSDNSANNPCINDAEGVWSAPVYDINSNLQYDSEYFWFHHSAADTMETIDPEQLNRGTAAIAIWTYAIAQLPELLPRDEAAPAPAPSPSPKKDSADVAHILIGIGLLLLALLVYIYSSMIQPPSNPSKAQLPADSSINSSPLLYDSVPNSDTA